MCTVHALTELAKQILQQRDIRPVVKQSSCWYLEGRRGLDLLSVLALQPHALTHMSPNGLETCLGVPAERPETTVDASKLYSESSVSESIGSWDVVNPHLETYIQILASMQPTRPDIVRGIPVCQALQRTPRLWARGDLDALHVYSQATLELDEFWSHSWRTPGWLKYISILVLHNSFPACVVGTLFAVASFVLCVADILPTWSRGELQSGWSVLTGTVSYYLTLLLWRRGKLAFLDIACINQVDDQLKTEGLISMGAILKRSKSLLVLWDSSYTSRLWCMFAAWFW